MDLPTLAQNPDWRHAAILAAAMAVLLLIMEYVRHTGVPVPVPLLIVFAGVVATGLYAGTPGGNLGGGVAAAYAAYGGFLCPQPLPELNTPLSVLIAMGIFLATGAGVARLGERRLFPAPTTEPFSNDGEAVEEIEAHFRAVLDHAPMMLQIKDAEGRYVFVSKTYADWMHQPANELIGKKPADFLDRERADLLSSWDKRVLESGETISEDREAMLSPDGTPHVLKFIKFPIRGRDGRAIYVATAMVDITQQSKMAEELAEKAQLLRTVLDNMPLSFNLKDLEGRYLDINNLLVERYARPREEIIGHTVDAMMPEATASNANAADQERAVLETGEVQIREDLQSFANGEARHFQLVKFPVKNAEGETYAIGTVGLDISELKEAQKTQKMLFDAIESLPIAVALFDAEDRLVMANTYAETGTSWARDMLVPGNTYEQIIRECVLRGTPVNSRGDDTEPWIQERLAKFRSGKGTTENILPDGRVMLAVERKTPEDNTVSLRFDITEQAQARKALQESETVLKSILDNAPIMLGMKDLEGRFVSGNQVFAEWHHTTPEDLIGKTSHDIMFPDRADNVVALDRKVIERGEVIVNEAQSDLQKQPDGFPTHLRLYKFPVKDRDGTVTGVGSAMLDITPQKRAEAELKRHLDQLEELIDERTRELRHSEESLRQILEHSPIGVAIIRRNPHRRIFINPSFREMFGAKTNEELNAVPMEDTYVNVEDYERLRRQTDEIGRVDGAEVLRKRLDGSHWWLLLHSRLVEFEGDTAAIVWHVDITEWKKAQKAIADQAQALEKTVTERTRDLEASKDLLSSIINNLPVGLIVKDTDHRVDVINRTALDWYGFDETTVVGKRTTDFDPHLQSEGSADQITAHEEAVLSTGRPQERMVQRSFEDGEERVLSVIKFPIFDGKGKIYKVGSVGLDLTEQVSAENAARTAFLEAERANQAKSEFLATMSHEFRTPLNAILGFSEMLRAQYFGPLGADNYKDYAADIHRSGEHMLALINDILDISAIEAGKRLMTVELLQLGELLDDALRNVEQAARSGGITISKEITRELPAIPVDRRSFVQIVLNLLSNAIKYTELGGTILVSAEPAGDTGVTVTVKDTGVGIPADKLSLVTEPFAQTHSDPHKAQTGTGLGLAIVKSLVDAHGGDLSITSELGVGTTVKVTFPLEQAPGD